VIDACEFWFPGIYLHDGGSIYLVTRVSYTGSFGPGDRFIGPRTALWGTESHVTPAVKFDSFNNLPSSVRADCIILHSVKSDH